MRIVIDLQACQRSLPAPEASTLLQLAQQLARSATPTHQVVVALSDRHPAAIMTLRQAFAGLAEVVLYALPPLDTASAADAVWLARASEQIRAAFLATLQPDLVWTPGLDAALDVAAVIPLFDSYATLATLAAGSSDDIAALWPL